ncbi:glycoside hydrolase family 19 protein [Burkholderia gladioli]|uniref:glycoside hydrolase family 19 protein n=1 Tax=Burkholderia gladioli TaxID=28095 RepID=UPI000F52FB14|nr:glycoside hydrolase family 19 protein [Burkholderia gladioli]
MAQQPEQSSKVESWAYPCQLKDKGSAHGPEDYLKALAAADDGFYPIGANGLWHGGIHLGAKTAGKFDQDNGIKCIADGEVVAFRLDSKLQEITFPDGIKAGYSRGFTLVRHKLTLPAATARTTAGNGPAPTPMDGPPPAADILTFFSLYMHTLPLDGYDASQPPGASSVKKLPDYYGASEIYSVGTKASDPRATSTDANDTGAAPLGLRVRASFSSHSNVVGWLARGTQLKVGHTHRGWGKISSFVSGSMQAYEEGHTDPVATNFGWVYLGELDKQLQPSAVDQVYVLPQPHKISAGETVAYLGEYQRLVEARAHHTLPPKLGERPLIHVEVFTGDDLNSFITRSRGRAQQLDPKARQLLLISKGAKLVQPSVADTSIPAGTTVKATSDSPTGGPWVRVVPINAAGHPIAGRAAVWVASSDLQAGGERPAWRDFPLSVQAASGVAAAWTRVIYTPSAQSFSEAEGKTWYAVSIGDENDAQVDGWVCDHGHPLVELKSSWDWPGFDIVSLDKSVSDMFQRALFIADNGTPDELATFEDSFNGARSDETIKKLEDAIDGGDQKDGKITAHELQLALGKPWLADRLDHLIVRYESEWGGEMSKWDALDAHMHAGLPVWKAEKARIDALRYWSNVSGVTDFPTSPVVYHLHPIGIVGNFSSAALKCMACGADLTMTRHILTTLFPNITTSNADKYATDLTKAFKKYSLNTCARVSHFLGQASVECTNFTSFEESLVYRDGHRLWGIYHSALVAGLKRLNPSWTEAQMRTYTETHLANNDPELGKVLFGNSQYPDVDYRGRGPLAVTWDTTYRRYQDESGTTVMPNPRLFATDSAIGCDSSAWFWKTNGISEPADRNSLHDVTHIINKALLRIRDRGNMAKRAFALLNGANNPCSEKWQSALTAANGW